MTAPGYYPEDDPQIDALQELIARRTDPARVPHAARIAREVPVYSGPALLPKLSGTADRRAIMAEWADVLAHGAGVFVIEAAMTDHEVLDQVTGIFTSIIDRERSATAGDGDHFAPAGANDRVWNALQKLCLSDPALFARYHGNPLVDTAAEAWLGPGYQMTAQVNLVRPGGAAQEAHRDYHLGFQNAETAASYPAHVHALTPALTLQGGLAHCDMPVESGPTRLLPFSQMHAPGYVAFRTPEVRTLFNERTVQLPLAKGDALFFNPALYHAAGANRSADIQRMANLFQVSSAFGRAMESVDRAGMCRVLYPVLAGFLANGALSKAQARAAIAAAAEGYAFPTSLDTDPPIGGLAPETQAALFTRALETGMTVQEFETALAAQSARRLA